MPPQASEPIIHFPDEDDEDAFGIVALLHDPKNLLPKEIWLVPEAERSKVPAPKAYLGSIEKDVFSQRHRDDIF